MKIEIQSLHQGHASPEGRFASQCRTFHIHALGDDYTEAGDFLRAVHGKLEWNNAAFLVVTNSQKGAIRGLKRISGFWSKVKAVINGGLYAKRVGTAFTGSQYWIVYKFNKA
jgi:hypothetical protein